MPEEKENREPTATPGAAPPPVTEEELDAAHESLAAALRVSFTVLKFVILVVVACYLGSGVYMLDTDEIAIALVFGKLAGAADEAVKGPGGLHLNWPAPVGQVVRINTRVRSLNVNTFWPVVSQGEMEEAAGDAQGKPEQTRQRSAARAYEGAENAYLMTGDLTEAGGGESGGATVRREEPAPNLLQARFTVRYKITPGSALDYFRSVEDEEAELRLVKYCLEAGAIREAARLKVYDVLKARTELFRLRVTDALQASLNEAGSGIRVDTVSMADPVPPKTVGDSFRDVGAAQQELHSLTRSAEAYKNELLSKTAGEVGGKLGDAIVAVWDAEDKFAAEDNEREDAVKAGKAKPLGGAERAEIQKRREAERERMRKTIEEDYLAAGGDVRRITEDAKASGRRTVGRAQGMARRLENILDKYSGQPEFLEILRLEAVSEFFKGALEKYYVTKKAGGTREVRIVLGRSAEAQKREVPDTR